MEDLKSRVAYLQGLSTGLDLDAESKESKLLNGIIEVLGDFADSMSDLEDSQEQLEDYLESIDEGLCQLEDEIYDGEGVDDYTSAGDYHEVDCPGCGETVCFDRAVLEDDDVIEVTCPNCGEVVFVNEDSYLNGEEPEVYDEQLTGSKVGAKEEDI